MACGATTSRARPPPVTPGGRARDKDEPGSPLPPPPGRIVELAEAEAAKTGMDELIQLGRITGESEGKGEEEVTPVATQTSQMVAPSVATEEGEVDWDMEGAEAAATQPTQTETAGEPIMDPRH